MRGTTIMRLIMVLTLLLVSACTNTHSERIDLDGDEPVVDGDQPVIDGDADGDQSTGASVCPESVVYDLEDGFEYPADGTVRITNLQLFQNPNNVLSYFVEWTTSAPVPTKLKVTCTVDYKQEFSDDTPKTSHQVFVMGLIAKTDCRFDALAEDGTGGTNVATERVENIGPLPEGLPKFGITCADAQDEQLQPGWTLFNLVHTMGLIPLTAVIVDHHGRYRWYYTVPTEYYGSDNDMRVVPEGVMIGGTEDKIRARLVDWEGRQLWKIERYMHHHLDYAPAYFGENKVIYLSWTDDCNGPGWEGQAIRSSGTMVVLNLQTRQTDWVWKLCDHYVPPVIVEDWCHLNSIDTFPDGSALLISSREQHALFKVNLQSEEVEWKLGLNGDFAMADEDLFYRQHAAKALANGNILLFDNGNENAPGNRSWSRAIEIAYNEESMTAEVVWQYRPDPDIFAPIWSDADLLSNGNRLVTFGRDWQTSHIIEVTGDDAPKMLWRLDTTEPYGIYRAERVESPGFGYVMKDAD